MLFLLFLTTDNPGENIKAHTAATEQSNLV